MHEQNRKYKLYKQLRRSLNFSNPFPLTQFTPLPQRSPPLGAFFFSKISKILRTTAKKFPVFY